MIKATNGDALLLVDVQNDNLPGGSVAIAGGDSVLEPLASVINILQPRGIPIYATRDWHPANHCSFQQQGGALPVHCVADTPGAQAPSTLGLPPFTMMVSKSDSAEQDACSGFDGTKLAFQLKMYGVKRLLVGGLATDGAVLDTVKDAIKLGFQVYILVDGTHPRNAADGETSIAEMTALGAIPLSCAQIS